MQRKLRRQKSLKGAHPRERNPTKGKWKSDNLRRRKATRDLLGGQKTAEQGAREGVPIEQGVQKRGSVRGGEVPQELNLEGVPGSNISKTPGGRNDNPGF